MSFRQRLLMHNNHHHHHHLQHHYTRSKRKSIIVGLDGVERLNSLPYGRSVVTSYSSFSSFSSALLQKRVPVALTSSSSSSSFVNTVLTIRSTATSTHSTTQFPQQQQQLLSSIRTTIPSKSSAVLPPPLLSPPRASVWMNRTWKAAAAFIATTTLYAFYIEYNAELMSKHYHHAKNDNKVNADNNNNDKEEEDEEEDATFVKDGTVNHRSIVELPRVYNWEALNTYWSHRPISTIYRLLQINYHLVPLIYRYVQDFIILPKLVRLSNSHHDKDSTAVTKELYQQQQQQQLQRSHAVAWRDTLTELGPAFVKAGQQVSIRPDLVSPIVLQILQQLCDNVQPISNDIAYQILQKEFHITNVTDIFIEPPQLVASASLGQVYRGKLRTVRNNSDATDDDLNVSRNDKRKEEEYIDVAIKVQRPGMVESFSLDLFLLQRFSIVVDIFTSIFTHQPPFHRALYESFANGSYSELDYENEAANQMYFYHEFQKRTLPVLIPKVYTDYTTRTVLTSQWIDGIKLADAPLEQIRQLIPVGVELFLTQLLDLGTFHADPHVGNLLVQNGTGTLCLIDFGLCATVSEQDRRAMTMAIVHIIQRDFATLIHKDSKALGFLPQDCDTTELFPILTKILTVGLLDSPSSNIRVRRRKLLEISNELNDVFFHYPFTVPPYFALITRGLGLLEGIALSGDEDFDIFQAAAPYARRRAMQILYGRISNNKKSTNSSRTSEMRSIF